MPDPERILLIRPTALGDVCRTVPVLASLRARFPQAAIDWLVRDVFIDAIQDHPSLTRAIPFRRDRLGTLARPARAGALGSWLLELRRARYDLVIDAQGLARSGVFAWISGAPVRIGHARAQEFAWLGYTRRVRTDPDTHTVDRMLSLAAAAGARPQCDPTIYPSDRGREEATRLLGEGIEPIVLAPGSIWEGKRWAGPRFAALAKAILDAVSSNQPIAVIGSPSERSQCRAVTELATREPRVLDLVGRSSIAGILGVIERARVVVANDSAPAHIAVGLHRPLVALYGPTDPHRVGPYQRLGDVIHHPAQTDWDRLRDPRAYRDEAFGRAMMDRINVDEVLGATMDRLVKQPPGSGSPGSGGDQPLAASNDRMNSAKASQPDLGNAL